MSLPRASESPVGRSGKMYQIPTCSEPPATLLVSTLSGFVSQKVESAIHSPQTVPSLESGAFMALQTSQLRSVGNKEPKRVHRAKLRSITLRTSIPSSKKRQWPR